MNDKLNPLWDEFILWLALPEAKRGAVATEEEWAQAHGYSNSRQLRRWKTNEEFLARQVELTSALTGDVSSDDAASGLSSLDTPLTGAEADYHAVKTQLFNAAKSGNLKAMEQYMKLYGKTWIEEEAASRSSDFTGADFDVLVSESLALLAEDSLVAALRACGWLVSRPDDSGPEGAGDAGPARV